jgi:hypothetical protein
LEIAVGHFEGFVGGGWGENVPNVARMATQGSSKDAVDLGVACT